MKTNSLIKGLVLLFMLTFLSCGPDTIFLQLKLDTPEHHVATGMKFLESGKMPDAFREFDRAKELDPNYSPAYVGMGLVYGFQEDFDKSFQYMQTAALNAKGTKQTIGTHVGMMRLYLMGQEKIDVNWLLHVNKAFDSAIAISGNIPDPYYYMGMAYKLSSNFEKSIPLFLKVIELDQAYSNEAQMEYDKINE